MVNLDVIKENIQFARSLGESVIDTPLREEYLIPDTHPDVNQILSVDIKAVITNKEVQVERFLVETQVEFNVIYLAREEEGLGINNVIYREKLSNFIEVTGAEHRMVCDAECEIEHINANIINERKISIEAYLRTKCNVNKIESIEFVKDIAGSGDVQLRRKSDKVEKIIANKIVNMNSKAQLKVGMDKPQVGKIIKCNYMPHKKEIKISEDKVYTSCLMKVEIMYKAYESREVVSLEEDILISNEEELIGISSDMTANGEFRVASSDEKISQDDLGESRIIDIEVLVDADVKVNKIEEIEIIEDTYSPTRSMIIARDKANVNMTVGEGTNETIVKDNISIDKDDINAVQVINSSGKIVSMEGKIVGGKVVVEGILKVDTIYKCDNEDTYLGTVSGDVMFGTSIDIPNSKDEMECVVKGNLESLQSNIEANTIAIKAVISTYARVTTLVNKEYVIDIEQRDEVLEKTASIIIYVVQADDTIWSLAKKYNTTISEIAKLNSIENTDVIIEGQKLIIPGRALV